MYLRMYVYGIVCTDCLSCYSSMHRSVDLTGEQFTIGCTRTMASTDRSTSNH